MSVLDRLAAESDSPLVRLYAHMRAELVSLSDIQVLLAARSALGFLAASAAEEPGPVPADGARHYRNEGAK